MARPRPGPTPSPDGRGTLIGELTITESAPVPEALGAASSPGQELVEQTYHLGTDAACEEITADATVARNRVEVALADDVLPWAHTLRTALYADGELLRGFSRVHPTAAEAGVLSYQIDRICDAEDPSVFDSRPNKLEEGRHDVHIVAALGLADFARIESTATSIVIDCGGDGDGAGDAGPGGGASDGGDGVGCAVASPSMPWTGIALALLVSGALLWRRRAGASCPKGPAAP